MQPLLLLPMPSYLFCSDASEGNGYGTELYIPSEARLFCRPIPTDSRSKASRWDLSRIKNVQVVVINLDLRYALSASILKL